MSNYYKKIILIIILILGVWIMPNNFIKDIIKNANDLIKYKNTVTTGEITADNGDGTYDVKIANAGSSYPDVETITYGAVFSVGEIVDIVFEHGCKEAPKIIGHSKKIKQEPLQVEVDYSGGGGDPITTVTTLDAYLKTAISAFLEGKIELSNGAGNCTRRGFHYGLTIAYGSDIHDDGDYGEGYFNKQITGLDPETTYHFQAYVLDANGDEQLGEDKIFTTKEAEEETLTIYGSIQDGVLRKQASTYVPCHDGSEADEDPQEASRYFNPYTLDVGQTFADIPFDIYDIQRIALIFDTSAIPVGATIISAIIYLYCWNSAEGTAWFVAGYGGKLLCIADFDIVVQNGQPTYPHIPVVEADYNYTYYSGDGGSVNTADINEGSFNTITLNSTGRNWINKGGITKLLLRSQRDIDSTPDVTEPRTISFISSDFTSPSGYIPKLVITYTI